MSQLVCVLKYFVKSGLFFIHDNVQEMLMFKLFSNGLCIKLICVKGITVYLILTMFSNKTHYSISLKAIISRIPINSSVEYAIASNHA